MIALSQEKYRPKQGEHMILIEHIDEIARRIQRDVLFLEFNSNRQIDISIPSPKENGDRDKIINWLDQHSVPWTMCGPMMRKNYITGYQGGIFINVEVNPENVLYQSVLTFLENQDGTSRFENVRVLVLRLAVALENNIALGQSKLIDHLFGSDEENEV